MGDKVEKDEVIALVDRDVTDQVCEYHKVTSSIDGILLKTDVDEGMMFSPKTSVAVVGNISWYRVKLSVPEIYRGKVKEGLHCKIKVYSMDKELSGEVVKVEGVVDPMVAEFPVEVKKIDANDIFLYPG